MPADFTSLSYGFDIAFRLKLLNLVPAGPLSRPAAVAAVNAALTHSATDAVKILMDGNIDQLIETSRDVSSPEFKTVPDGAVKAVQLLITGLGVDGDHHKQWIIEQALTALGVDLVVMREIWTADGYDWKPGRAP